MEHLLSDQKGASSPSMPKFRAFQIEGLRCQKVVFVALVISEFEQKERGKICILKTDNACSWYIVVGN